MGCPTALKATRFLLEQSAAGWKHPVDTSSRKNNIERACYVHLSSRKRLYGLVFAAKRRVKGAATLTSFAL